MALVQLAGGALAAADVGERLAGRVALALALALSLERSWRSSVILLADVAELLVEHAVRAIPGGGRHGAPLQG